MNVKERNIVIIGGGVIGTTAAYFLSHHSSFKRSIHSIIILEATSLASGASGKAGGLLALWAYPSCIVPLSYRLHAELAFKHNGRERWGYRNLDCGSVRAVGKFSQSRGTGSPVSKNKKRDELPKSDNSASLVRGLPEKLDWIDRESVRAYQTMGGPETTAQVHPYLFTTSMADLAVEAGAQVIYGRVTSINYNSEGIHGISYEEKVSKISHDLKATDVVLAAGPWTSHLLSPAPIGAVRAHSVVIEADVSPYAIFSEISLPKELLRQKHDPIVTPEMYARPDGTVYACGEANASVPLPISSDLVLCDENECQDIIDSVSTISTILKEGRVLKKQACYLPNVEHGSGPLIGKTKINGLILAAGHSCWGIQNCCATGKLISEIVFDGSPKSANIDTLDPRRYV